METPPSRPKSGRGMPDFAPVPAVSSDQRLAALTPMPPHRICQPGLACCLLISCRHKPEPLQVTGLIGHLQTAGRTGAVSPLRMHWSEYCQPLARRPVRVWGESGHSTARFRVRPKRFHQENAEDSNRNPRIRAGRQALRMAHAATAAEAGIPPLPARRTYLLYSAVPDFIPPSSAPQPCQYAGSSLPAQIPRKGIRGTSAGWTPGRWAGPASFSAHTRRPGL